MGFEIRDGKDNIPDEEDVYGVNDAEERDRFNALFGKSTQEVRVHRRRLIMRITAGLVLLAFVCAFVVIGPTVGLVALALVLALVVIGLRHLIG